MNSQDISSRYPLLDQIDSPADLRTLPVEKLKDVCADIRRKLIDTLSEHPGHFASSMGAVELTVALHYVFNTPYDRLVWDVGHQAYGHKLLTGRRDRFDTNRTLGGLSGFPNPAESEYDTFSAGHASNSISAALGMAVASRLKGELPKRNVVAVIGDASISGGLAFEGLNNAANTPNNLLIVLNDNDMAIDDNVGSLNSYLAHITTSKPYNDLRYRVFNLMKRLHIVSDNSRGRIMRFNNSLKSLITDQQNIFEGLNIRYFGPFDGHDVETLVKVLNDIKDIEGPRILHLRTVKGKGYLPAEKNPTPWHAPGKFDPATGRRAEEDAPTEGVALKYQDVFGNTLLELAKADQRVVAITAAMASGTGVSIMQKEIPERTFDVGISEGHAVTFAGGLAKDGFLPFVAIYSTFLQRAYDNIINDVALQNLPVTFCIDRAGIVGEDGATHHGALDLSYLRAVPNLIVSAPSDEATLRNLMYTAAKTPHGPFAIRYPRGKGHNPNWQTHMQPLPVGRGRCLREGKNVIVLSIGTIASEVSKAIEKVTGEGVDAAHYDMIFLKPIDKDILHQAAKSGLPIITVEDGTINGGLGSAVAEFMAENGYTNHLVRMGLPDEFVTQGTVPQLLDLCKIDSNAIYKEIIKASTEK